MQYLLGFAKQFQEYYKSPTINIKKDMSGFSLSHLYLSDEELTELMESISNIVKTVEKNEPKAGRKLRTLGIIITPPEKIE